MTISNKKANSLFLLFFTLIWTAQVIQGSTITSVDSYLQSSYRNSASDKDLQGIISKLWTRHNYARRLMIGSVAPTCTYNECRGCKSKCRAEQVPVEGNDPMNSAYHYKCICHG